MSDVEVEKRITPSQLSFSEMEVSFDCGNLFKDEVTIIETQSEENLDKQSLDPPDEEVISQKILLLDLEDSLAVVKSRLFQSSHKTP